MEVLRYINPKLLKDIDTKKDIEITQSQGSAEICIAITDNVFSIKAPFLKITEQTNKVALLRRVAEANFSPLTLANITLHGDELWFEYEMPIELSQPNKLYDILREVCIYADDYDDIFIEKYNATFYKEPAKTTLSDTEKEEVWNQIAGIFEDYKNYSHFFKDKRWDSYVWDILVISLLKISNMPYVQGKLRSDLITNIAQLFDGNVDFNYRVDKGVNYMKKLSSLSKEDILKNVYHAEQFTSLRWRSSPQIISDRLKNNIERVVKYEKEESYFNLSYYLQYTLLKLIFDYNLEDSYRTTIEDVLEEVSGLDPDEAAPKLVKVFYALQEGTINKKEVKEEESKGFFSKLFN